MLVETEALTAILGFLALTSTATMLSLRHCLSCFFAFHGFIFDSCCFSVLWNSYAVTTSCRSRGCLVIIGHAWRNSVRLLYPSAFACSSVMSARRCSYLFVIWGEIRVLGFVG